MADENPDFVERDELLQRAVQQKKRRFTRNGILLLASGLVLIGIGLLLNTGVRSLEGLLVSVGVITFFIGILVLLIGFINPSLPDQA